MIAVLNRNIPYQPIKICQFLASDDKMFVILTTDVDNVLTLADHTSITVDLNNITFFRFRIISQNGIDQVLCTFCIPH